VVAASAAITLGLVASALVRRAGGAASRADPAREAFLDERRERMRLARTRLLAPTDRGA
jgi:hypothetical protein